eukprot:TRINITY_DN2099_c1_g1_i3.p1 TRINITY_DN2099_c1_g1~~TRINITY_DN2099_c1_g1_i3.p1  ORF type:complete len:124 (+),score=15.96 TRINITY_DN2099_c1_g1_i3:32-373(+)
MPESESELDGPESQSNALQSPDNRLESSQTEDDIDQPQQEDDITSRPDLVDEFDMPEARAASSVVRSLCKSHCVAISGMCIKRTIQFYKYSRYIRRWANRKEYRLLQHLGLLC